MACNTSKRLYQLFLIPPIPFPVWRTEPAPKRIVLGLRLGVRGRVHVDLSRVLLESPSGNASVERWGADIGSLWPSSGDGHVEPCRNPPDLQRPVPAEPVTLTGGSTLWLQFDAGADPTVARVLHVGDVREDDVPLAIPSIELQPGSRGYTFFNAP
jgi:hypothetical protein